MTSAASSLMLRSPPICVSDSNLILGSPKDSPLFVSLMDLDVESLNQSSQSAREAKLCDFGAAATVSPGGKILKRKKGAFSPGPNGPGTAFLTGSEERPQSPSHRPV